MWPHKPMSRQISSLKTNQVLTVLSCKARTTVVISKPILKIRRTLDLAPSFHNGGHLHSLHSEETRIFYKPATVISSSLSQTPFDGSNAKLDGVTGWDVVFFNNKTAKFIRRDTWFTIDAIRNIMLMAGVFDSTICETQTGLRRFRLIMKAKAMLQCLIDGKNALLTWPIWNLHLRRLPPPQCCNALRWGYASHWSVDNQGPHRVLH